METDGVGGGSTTGGGRVGATVGLAFGAGLTFLPLGGACFGEVGSGDVGTACFVDGRGGERGGWMDVTRDFFLPVLFHVVGSLSISIASAQSPSLSEGTESSIAHVGSSSALCVNIIAIKGSL